jgi:hypothetical protein
LLNWVAEHKTKFVTFQRGVSYSRLIPPEVLMKRLSLTLAICLIFVKTGATQQSASDAPATKEDVQKYLDVMHSREMMAQMVEAMSKPMHQMIHDRYVKDKDKLPPDFEARMNKMMDDTMKAFPWDEMMESMVPVYQKHLTKGDVDALTAFYGSPTGQKILRELPAITAEAMQSMMPMMQKQMKTMTERVQEEVAQMLKDSKVKPDAKSQVSPN